MPMTYQQAAQAALDCQDACNLSGVVFSFAEAMHAICEEGHAKNMGTQWKNENPIVYLFISKLADLAGYHEAEMWSDKYDAVQEIARG